MSVARRARLLVPTSAGSKRLLAALLLLLIACCMARPLRDPDLWFHIVCGRWIVSHHEVPTQDYWNMFGAGRPWRAYSWLGQVLFALVERSVGLRGLISLELCTISLFLLASVWSLASTSRSLLLGFLLTLLSAVGCYWHISLRPQTLTWILYPVVILLSERIRARGLSVGYGAKLAGILCLWANIHVSTVIPLATIALLVERERTGRVATLLFACFVATLLTPNFGAEWFSAVNYVGHPATFTLISELRPVTFLDPWSVPLLIGAALLLWLCHRIPRALSLRVLAGWLVLLCLSLAVMRFIPFAVMLTCGLIAQILGEQKGPREAVLRLTEKRVVRRALVVVMLVITGVSIKVAHLRLVQAWDRVTDSNSVARGAVDFIESRSLPKPILNSFEDGHYLMYRYADQNGEPGYRVPIDGRTEVNTKEAWDEFRASYLGAERWQDFIDLVKAKTIIWPTGSPFVRILTASGQWCLVYQDGPVTGTSVLVQRSVWEERRAHLDSVNCY